MKTTQLRALIREEVVSQLKEETPAEVQRSTQYATIQCLRSALDTLTRQYNKNRTSTKSAEIVSKETDLILAKYGFEKLDNFNELYTTRLRKDPTKVG